MNKRQQKKKAGASNGAQELEQLTGRVEGHISDLNRLINQQRVMLEIQNLNLKYFSLWQKWGVTLPAHTGFYVVYNSNGNFGLLYFNEGVYMDQNKKRIDAKRLETIIAWFPLPAVPVSFLR